MKTANSARFGGLRKGFQLFKIRIHRGMRARIETSRNRAHWIANGGAHLVPKNPAFDGSITEEEHRRLMSGGA